LPWAGIEKTQLESINYADVKAAEKMARLYDEIVKHNSIETADDVHRLNIFFSGCCSVSSLKTLASSRTGSSPTASDP